MKSTDKKMLQTMKVLPTKEEMNQKVNDFQKEVYDFIEQWKTETTSTRVLLVTALNCLLITERKEKKFVFNNKPLFEGTRFVEEYSEEGKLFLIRYYNDVVVDVIEHYFK